MAWKNIRLELDRTNDFPRGSASRSYLLRLPLGEDGAIDAEELKDQPYRATVRRFWPSEPDLAGYVVPGGGGWELAYERGAPGSGHIETTALLLGECVTLVEPDGRSLPFRVAAVESLAG